MIVSIGTIALQVYEIIFRKQSNLLILLLHIKKSACLYPEALKGTDRFFFFLPLGYGVMKEKNRK
jgi:hypothetical protein